ncbi:MAG: guanitoxin biosynthesis heme-dependent pre-guanitoxin N-hydroxylase GntA [Oceanicaulis sp.]
MSLSKRRQAFEKFLKSRSFTCVGAKAALVQNQLRVVEAGAIDSPLHDVEIRTAVIDFIAELDRDGPRLQSLVVLFEGPGDLCEASFERILWSRLQALRNMDVAAGEPWAEDVSPDPNSAHFSMSLAGEPFFVVGLHSGASRPARRFAYPAMVFNAHRQFDALRADGRYDTMKAIIREREEAAYGSINPMLADFGEGREAAQYSGRQVGARWRPEFDPKVCLKPKADAKQD